MDGGGDVGGVFKHAGNCTGKEKKVWMRPFYRAGRSLRTSSTLEDRDYSGAPL